MRSADPAAILSGPKRGRGLPKVLSISDVERLLARAKASTETPDASALQRLRAIRLYCLLEVLYATGLRVSELVALPRSASRRDARMIVVRGKGNKERLVPLNETSRQAMADYLAALEALKPEKKKNAANSKWLFPSFGDSGHLTRQHFARDLKQLAASAGLAPRLISDLLSRIRLLVDRGLPVLLVEQNVKAALKVVDHLYLLERGRIVGEGPADVMAADHRIVEAYLGTIAAGARA